MKFSSKWARSFAATALLCCSFAIARAQDATTGSISGTITDPTGAAIKGATVVLINTDRNHIERTLSTNNDGYYTATALPLGNYEVKVTYTGFKAFTEKKLTLHVADALNVSHALTTGDTTETVTVNAEGGTQVNLQDATQAGLINSNQINELVMISRNYESLINLQPGVAFSGTTDQLQRGPVGVNGSSSQAAFSVNGGRTSANNWTIDGADNLDRGSNLTLYVYPSADAIAEFKTLRGNYSASAGRDSGGQVDVVTKSGTNDIHGSAFEYFRNDYLDADPYANNALVVKAPIPKYRYNDFGFSLGGPVWLPKIYNGRDKTFWFVSENWLREITYTPASSTGAVVPTPAEVAGDFSNEWYRQGGNTGPWITGPVNVCTAYTNNPATQVNTCTAQGTNVSGAISPVAQQYLKDIYSTIPQNTPAQQQALAAKGVDPRTIYSPNLRNEYPNLDSVVRIDQQFGQKVTALYRYVHDTFPEYIGAGTFTAVQIPGISPTTSTNPGTQHLGKVTWTATPTIVVNVGYAYSRGQIVTAPVGNLRQSVAKDVNVPTPFPNQTGIVPTIAVGGYTSIGANPIYDDHSLNHQGFGDITKVLHNHTLIAGVSFNHYNKRENATGGNQQGSFGFTTDATYVTAGTVTVPANSYSTTTPSVSTSVGEAQSFANFLTGNANNGFSQNNRLPQVDMYQNIYEGYLQDNWKASSRLTVNAGVRYGYLAQPTDSAGYLSSFDPLTYSDSKAPTIANTGLICTTGTCVQVGSNAGQSGLPNAGADIVGANYINGLIFGTPDASKNNQASPYGKAISTSQKLNFAPRVGFAYDLFGDGTTSFRGGYGIVFDEMAVSQWELPGIGLSYAANPPAVTPYSVTQAVLDNPSGGTISNSTFANNATPAHLYALPLHTSTPYTQQYSLGFQTQFSPNLFVEVSYVGNHGTHLAGDEEINQPHAGAFRGVVSPQFSGYTATNMNGASNCNLSSTGAGIPLFWNSTCDRVLNQIKPYKGYYGIDTLQTIFSANYNSLQAKITYRGRGKSFIDGNFTWSRDLTNDPSDSVFVQDIYNVNGDYGRANYDRKLIFNIDGVYELPWYRDQRGFVGHLIGGWEFSGILAMNSGLPFTVSTSGATLVTYNGSSQPLTYPSNPNMYANDNAGLALLGSTNVALRTNQLGDPNSGNGKQLKAGHRFDQSGAPSIEFNTGVFYNTDPLSNVPANAKRGTINGPGFIRADVGAFRNFRLYKNINFQLRGEAFNVANHANPASIVTAASSAYFGEISAYRDPRILQIAGRISF